MPVLTVQTNVADAQFTNELLKQLSAKVAQATGKPEQYVVVHVSAGQKLFFGGSNEPAAYMELASIGLSANQTSSISNQIMSFFEEKFHVKPNRIYIKFTSAEGNMFGWNKGTF